MKKLMKFFVGLASIGATVAGAYYVVKKFLLKDSHDDFDDDFDEDFDDDIFNDSDEDEEKDVVPVKMEESGADESEDANEPEEPEESEETDKAE